MLDLLGYFCPLQVCVFLHVCRVPTARYKSIAFLSCWFCLHQKAFRDSSVLTILPFLCFSVLPAFFEILLFVAVFGLKKKPL